MVKTITFFIVELPIIRIKRRSNFSVRLRKLPRRVMMQNGTVSIMVAICILTKINTINNTISTIDIFKLVLICDKMRRSKLVVLEIY